MIVSPPKAGKTTVMKQIAHSIEANNPEVHLIVLLVDERPEEVTDMRRSVKGEVVASTFDRPSDEHTAIAELAIERAKRLVERGPGRGHHPRRHHPPGPRLQPGPPATGRIMSGGVDSGALTRPRGSSGRPATSKRVDRSPSWPPPWWRPAPRWTRSSSRSSRAPGTWSSASTAAGRAPALPVDRRQRQLDPPRGAPLRAGPAPAGLEAPAGAQRPGQRRQRRRRASSCSWTRSGPPRATTSSWPRSPRARPPDADGPRRHGIRAGVRRLRRPRNPYDWSDS